MFVICSLLMLNLVILPNEFNILTINSNYFIKDNGSSICSKFGAKRFVYVIRTCYSHNDSAETAMESS